MPYVLQSSAYDFAAKRVNAQIVRQDDNKLDAVTLTISYDLPGEIAADKIETHIIEIIKQKLRASSDFIVKSSDRPW